MKPRDILLEKMCEIYAKDAALFPHEYCMEKSLQIAEKFLKTGSLDFDQNEKVSYAHRALTTIDSTESETGIAIIRAWLMHDASVELRRVITAQDCEKLAIRIGLLLK
jgi:hypothetical protein